MERKGENKGVGDLGGERGIHRHGFFCSRYRHMKYDKIDDHHADPLVSRYRCPGDCTLLTKAFDHDRPYDFMNEPP